MCIVDPLPNSIRLGQIYSSLAENYQLGDKTEEADTQTFDSHADQKRQEDLVTQKNSSRRTDVCDTIE